MSRSLSAFLGCGMCLCVVLLMGVRPSAPAPAGALDTAAADEHHSPSLAEMVLPRPVAGALPETAHVAAASPTLSVHALHALRAQSECDEMYGKSYEPAPINTTAPDDGEEEHDLGLSLATNHQGTWIAVWSSTNPSPNDDQSLGEDPDILYARSNNDGATWSTPRAVVAPPGEDEDDDGMGDYNPSIGFSPFGQWIVVWEQGELDEDGEPLDDNLEIMCSTSDDLGDSWSDPVILSTEDPDEPDEPGINRNPAIASDGNSRWIVVWESNEPLENILDEPLEEDFDILFVNSIDNGTSWTLPAPVATGAAQDIYDDSRPRIAANTATGEWGVVWQGFDDTNGHMDVFSSFTDDMGDTWSQRVAVNPNAGATTEDMHPVIATNQSEWLVVWQSEDATLINGEDVGADFDLFAMRATDPANGWPDGPFLVNSTGIGTDRDDVNPTIDVDDTRSPNRWVVAWDSTNSHEDAEGSDRDVFSAVSIDGGRCWADPRLVNRNGADDTGNAPAADQNAMLRISRQIPSSEYGTGKVVVGWESDEDIGEELGNDVDLLYTNLFLRPPFFVDNDGDDMDDYWEIENGLDPDDPSDADEDPDGDDLDNIEEFEYDTDPFNEDTDGDGVSDGDEVDQRSDPLDPEDSEGPDVSTADLDAESLVRDGEALLPLTDWVPLWNVVMSYGEDPEDFAPRVLRRLVFTIERDSRDEDDLGYNTEGGPALVDLLEFGVFKEEPTPGPQNQTLDNDGSDDDRDRLMFTFDAEGNDRFDRVNVDVSANFAASGLQVSPITYTVEMSDDFGVPTDPLDPVQAERDTDDSIGGSYILAVRTSALWQSEVTLRTRLLEALMVAPGPNGAPGVEPGDYPLDDEGEFEDGYPDFPIEPEVAYSSSFSAFDMNGSPLDSWRPAFHNAWNQPRFGYAPSQEWLRPRFDATNVAFETIGAAILDLRQLEPLEQWRAVAGINLHSTKSVHFDRYDLQTQFPPDEPAVRIEGRDKDGAQLSEVNIVVTDIGGDPARPGSGGLDPRDAFNEISDAFVYGSNLDAEANDMTFNGLWVFHDTNGDGRFDPPVPLEGGGASITDAPLLPMSRVVSAAEEEAEEDIPYEWEYVPFPPGGGDPWWRLKLRFLEGARRDPDDISDDDNTVGYIEKTPDGSEKVSPVYPDYFVVTRADSGSKDASTIVGDGTAMPFGADYRVFIEPRRTNAEQGTEDGGIHTTSMIPGVGLSETSAVWQDDPRWLDGEPWWNERTLQPSNSLPLRHGIEVHDLTLVYDSCGQHAVVTDFLHGVERNLFGSLSFFFRGYVNPGAIGIIPREFGKWMDPFRLASERFFYEYDPGVIRWRSNGRFNFVTGLPFTFEDGLAVGQFAWETAPFRRPLSDPRSEMFPSPPEQPSLPSFANWPGGLDINEYPRASNWPQELRQSRILRQRTDILSEHTAMLGINLANTIDPIVNQQRRVLDQITVAFWGPDFDPEDLAELDPTGTSMNSGVLLWEDTDSSGTFIGNVLPSVFGNVPAFDEPVPVVDLEWPDRPEPVDLDGDGEPDDMNGDGVVDVRDHAWVVKLVPQRAWTIPDADRRNAELLDVDDLDLKTGEKQADAPPTPLSVKLDEAIALQADAKALDPQGAHGGDDLFISVRFSDKASRFQKVRAVIPATLPARTGPSNQRAGVQVFPEVNTAPDAFVKRNPEEDPVQDYYGHDMLEVNVPVRIESLTGGSETITAGGPGKAMLGIDASTNRDDATVASGDSGSPTERRFTVPGAAWEPDALAGDFLIDSNFESFEITGNTDERLTLLSGTPAGGPWRIVRNPTFLEQVWVEIYPELGGDELEELEGTGDTDTGGDTGDDEDELELRAHLETDAKAAKQDFSGFNPEDDLLPLDIDQTLSGVALYRDNDTHPDNRNGVWDPGIDIPVPMDAAPEFIGQPGEPNQVRFVFSTPGVDDFPIPKADQPRNRQWVPDAFGRTVADPEFGSDFFVVVRPSRRLDEGDAFSIGLVSWGPTSPTAPDPDSWTNAWGELNFEQRDEFVKFKGFPWADHALGFITMLKEQPRRYWFDGAVAKSEIEDNGFDYIRSSCTQKVQSNKLVATSPQIGPRTLVIEETTPVNARGRTELPSQTLGDESVTFVVHGQGFGTQPMAVLSGYDVTVSNAKDTSFQVRARVAADGVPSEPVVLIVRNPETGNEANRDDLFTLVEGSPEVRPQIASLAPRRADSGDFPVEVRGTDFDADAGVEVRFGETVMPVQSVTPTRIVVGFPVGGMGSVGDLDVRVRNLGSGHDDIAAAAFEYVNGAQRNTKVFLCGVAAKEQSGGKLAASDLLIVLMVVVLLAGAQWARRRRDGKTKA
ncbi:MAG: hypothetical protein ACLFTT_06025 [Candidatus Hydrogenedentota bacterium]